MFDGESLVRWSIRIAIAFYAARTLADAADVGSVRLRRILWTGGLIAFLIHVATAFQFVHHWSHDAAWSDTVRQTFEFTGWRNGMGLWVNYAFGLLWLGDALAWWTVGPDYPRRFRRTQLVVCATFAFIVFNATVVFGPNFYRPIAAAFVLVIAMAWVLRARLHRSTNR